MKKGHLSEHFTAVASKYLSAVEADSHRSNQHEFNGANKLREIFGSERQEFKTTFIYLCDDDPEPIKDDGYLTWYDARANNPNRSAEYRLYFPTTLVSNNTSEGDLMVIGRRPDDTILLIIAEADSTIEQQILWLFGLTDSVHPKFSVKGELESDQVKLEFASRYILEQIGIEPDVTDESFLDVMLDRFGNKFPTTKVFSDFARSTVKGISHEDNPDMVIMAWLDREEVLFRTLEKHIIGDKLREGFNDDVDSFVEFSLSVQNRRKSRAGKALENHLECLFANLSLRYSRTAVTENKSKPDFLFPGMEEYHNPDFNHLMLTMLGVKSTCKDRWRQILTEANRVKNKHLFTLEPGISANQTSEMKIHHVQLVIPEAIHPTFSDIQWSDLINLEEFISLVRYRQSR